MIPGNRFIVWEYYVVVASNMNARSKLRNVLLIAVFGLILLLAVPTLLDSTNTNIRLAIAQPKIRSLCPLAI
jgi:hypothetical protein